MRAVYLTAHGGPEVLQYGELPDPQPGPGQVRVRLHYAALNHLDLWVRRGWPGLRLTYPHILGADGAGVVDAVGPGVDAAWVGRRVVLNPNIGCGRCAYCLAGQDNRCDHWQLLGETRAGTYADFVVVPERNVWPVPDGFDLAQAAAAALVFQTAWHSLITRGGLRPGEWVLVVGASGGVNTASIQIAKRAGARVIVVGSNARKLALARDLGADFGIDRSQTPRWHREVLRLTNGRGVDVVVDNVGTTFPLSFKAARKGGRILTVGNTGGPVFEIDNRYIFGKHLSILGSTMSPQTDFRTVMDLVFAGHLRAVVDRVFPLAEARAAHAYLEAGQQLGKVVLRIADRTLTP